MRREAWREKRDDPMPYEGFNEEDFFFFFISYSAANYYAMQGEPNFLSASADDWQIENFAKYIRPRIRSSDRYRCIIATAVITSALAELGVGGCWLIHEFIDIDQFLFPSFSFENLNAGIAFRLFHLYFSARRVVPVLDDGCDSATCLENDDK